MINLHAMEKKIEDMEIALARRIKATRRSRGWSLADFEVASSGEIKAVVLGSYERCSRVISVRKLAAIARVFNVPVSYLLGANNATEITPGILMIDIRKVRENSNIQFLEKFFASIISKRGDWNGEILTLRSSDLEILSLHRLQDVAETMSYLRQMRYLIEPGLKR